MNFSQALEQIKSGAKLFREGWNGKQQFIELQVPDGNSKMSSPYIFMTVIGLVRVPWVASQSDLLAEDWEVTAGDTQSALPAEAASTPHNDRQPEEQAV